MLAGHDCLLHGLEEGPARVPVRRWAEDADTGDRLLLSQCRGPTLDIGCGPGRMTQALAVRGVPALGIDIAPTAVALARARGATALVRDVFGPLPGEGRWRCALLADGNIGIGGDPLKLLLRVRSLLCADGVVVVDLAPPGTHSGRCIVRLEHAGCRSQPFRWGIVAADTLHTLAEAAALEVLSVHDHAGRWFAQLQRPADGG